MNTAYQSQRGLAACARIPYYLLNLQLLSAFRAQSSNPAAEVHCETQQEVRRFYGSSRASRSPRANSPGRWSRMVQKNRLIQLAIDALLVTGVIVTTAVVIFPLIRL